MAQTLEASKFQQLDLKTLGRIGFESFGNLPYRLEIAKRLSASTKTDHAVFFDDVAYAVPEAQRSLLAGLPGYERVILPALLMAPGFKNGVSVICAAPPNPVERRNFMTMRAKLEETIGRKTQVRLLYEQGDGLIDLMDPTDTRYQEICDEYSQRMQDPKEVQSFTASRHVDLMNKYASQVLTYGERAYVSPFQVTQEHAQRLQEWVESGRVVLPDMPNMDKAYNNFLLKKEGLSLYLHSMMAVHADGTVITDLDNYIQKALSTKETSPLVFNKTQANLEKMANGILDCIDDLARQGLGSIVKLDSNGVSGLGNLMPGEFSQIYDQSSSHQDRLTALVKIMQEAYQQTDTLPQFAVVEEFINARKVEGFMYDLTVGGMMVDGVFMPLSIFPFGTDSNGVYDRGWIAAEAGLVKEDPQLWKKLFQAYSQMGDVMARFGYRNGVLAGDVLIREDGKLVFHDYNFRRGGRSTPEALIALLPNTGWFEVQLKLTSEHGLPHVESNKELVDTYTNVCQRLTDNYSIYPFSTSFGYFGWDGGSHPFMKLKLLVPMRFLENQPRNSHIQSIQNLVTNLLIDR